MINKKIINLIAIITIVFLSASFLFAETKNQPEKKKDTKKADEIQRSYNYGQYGTDLQRNTVSNIEFYTTNYGIFGNYVSQGVGGGYWPRGSQNQYIFGGGVWFGAKKMRPDRSEMKNYVEVTYNPNNGNSWMVPGSIEDGDKAEEENYSKYRTYFSTDFDKTFGTPLNSSDGPNWPVWDVSLDDTLMHNRYFGYYVFDESTRYRNFLPKGPAFISGEDIYCVFKDTDLSRFDGGETRRKDEGYPLQLQFEHTIYSWGFGDYRDFIFLRYDIINYSSDTLLDCWMSPVLDIDIALTSSSSEGARNDFVRFYDEEEDLNLAVAWTMDNYGEKGKGFGYLGFDFLESPSTFQCEEVIDSVINGETVQFCAMCIEHEWRWVKEIKKLYDTTWVDEEPVITERDTLVDVWREVCIDKMVFDPELDGFLRKDARSFENRYQLGLKTFRNWPIDDDKTDDDPRYLYMSSGIRDGKSLPGDIRILMATGPFTMLPQDTVRIIVGLILARPSIKEEADGTIEDLAELVRKDKFAQSVYDNNFQAPTPPEKCINAWKPLNNAITVTWDKTSEMSNDLLERGLDFLGYRLYRARRDNLDTFNIDQISSSVQYPSGKGPFGWKQIASWEMPTPFHKSVYRSGFEYDNPIYPLIDSLQIVGPVYDFSTNPPTLDKFAIKLMKVGKGVLFAQPLSHLKQISNACVPVIMSIDTALATKPWGYYYDSLAQGDEFPMFHDPFTKNPTHNYLIDSVLLGVIHLNKSLLSYNPLLWKRQTIIVAISDTSSIPDESGDTINFKSTYSEVIINGVKQLTMDRMVPIDPIAAMTDTNHIKNVLENVYYIIKYKLFEKIDFPDFENTQLVREQIIPEYMDQLTNNNTYIDIGDENGNYKIEYNEDPKKTEKIINNIDYHYKMLAYDEGDYTQPTEGKLNDGSVGNTNVVTAQAKAAPIGNKSQFEITYIDEDKMGGIYNLNMFAVDQDRVNQLFGDGRELELEFQPYWQLRELTLTETQVTKRFGMYHQRMILRDTKTNEELFNGITFFEASPCAFPYRGSFTEDAFSWVLSDKVIYDSISKKEIHFGVRDNDERVIRSGNFNSGNFTKENFCYAQYFNQTALGVLGFSFDFTAQQRGGRYRPDTAKTGIDKPANVSTIVTAMTEGEERNIDIVLATQKVDEDIVRNEYYNGGRIVPYEVYGSFNNGPGDYVVTFEEGGVEEMELIFNKGNEKTNTFRVPYLNLTIYNKASFAPPKGPSVIEYPGLLEHMTLPDSFPGNPFRFPELVKYFPDPRNLMRDNNSFIGKFNIHSFAWVNGRYKSNSIPNLNRQQACQTNKPEYIKLQKPTNVGTQGRYYLSAVSNDGVDTVDFVNMVQIAGINFAFDYANKGRRYPGDFTWKANDPASHIFKEDFKAGDKVTLVSTGGALGFPLPGAKVRFKVTDAQPSTYTDQMLDQIKVVPNPYMVSHQGQKSPYDAKIYFTKLPKRCSINIYTVMGDLVTTLEHDETSPYQDQESVEIWDLLSKNKQRVQSQTLVAVITTPDGAKTIKNFSVIVGGFRLIEDL